MKEIIEKIENGDRLTDGELIRAITHYQTLTDLLKPHGWLYHLVYSNACGRLMQLQGFFTARRAVRKIPEPTKINIE